MNGRVTNRAKVGQRQDVYDVESAALPAWMEGGDLRRAWDTANDEVEENARRTMSQ